MTLIDTLITWAVVLGVLGLFAAWCLLLALRDMDRGVPAPPDLEQTQPWWVG